MTSQPVRARTPREDIIDTMEYIYGPALLAAAFAWLFATSDPVQEVLLGYAADAYALMTLPEGGDQSPGFWAMGWRFTLQLSLPLLLLGLTPAATWSACRMALRANGRGDSTWSRALPVVFAVLLTGGIWCGVWQATNSPEAEDLDRNALILIAGSVIYSVLGLALPSVLRGVALIVQGPRAHWTDGGEFLARYAGVLAAIALVTVAVVVLTLRPDWGSRITAIGVASLFFIVMSYLLAGLTVLSRWTPGNVPLLLVLFAVAAAISSTGTALVLAGGTVFFVIVYRVAGGSFTGTGHLVQIGAFVLLLGVMAWATSRDSTCEHRAGCNHVVGAPPGDILPDPLAVYQGWPGKDLPIIRLVAAQGGGLFAAYHTAYYLATRADTEAGFAESVFAISGVSGGAVGGGIYWAIRASGLCTAPPAPDNTCHRDAVDQILRRDYLTPPLTGLFFRDNLDSFFPFTPWFDTPLDRGRVLEDAFAAAVADWQGEDDLLDTAMSKSWMPEKHAPLMFFNATEVGNGARRVLSPVARTAGNVPGRISLADGTDLTLATAMVTSARFPVVTPPTRAPVMEWVPTPDTGDGSTGVGEVRRVLQLVDGGYFDNSGIETLLDFIDALGAAHIGPGYGGQPVVQTGGTPRQIEVILFRDEKPSEPSEIKGTLGAPLAAFTNAWRARWDLTAERLMVKFDPAKTRTGIPPVLVCASTIRPDSFNYTVSWFLARRSFDDIQAQIARDRAGPVPGLPPQNCP